jgi:hypothetical protein
MYSSAEGQRGDVGSIRAQPAGTASEKAWKRIRWGRAIAIAKCKSSCKRPLKLKARAVTTVASLTFARAPVTSQKSKRRAVSSLSLKETLLRSCS